MQKDQCINGYTRPSLSVLPFVQLMNFFLYTLNELLAYYFTQNWCISMYIRRYFTWRQNFMQALSPASSAPKSGTKMQQKIQQKVQNDCVRLLIKRFLFHKLLECLS